MTRLESCVASTGQGERKEAKSALLSLITVAAAAERTGIQTDTLRKWLRKGRLHGLKWGDRWMVDPNDLTLLPQWGAAPALPACDQLPLDAAAPGECPPEPEGTAAPPESAETTSEVTVPTLEALAYRVQEARQRLADWRLLVLTSCREWEGAPRGCQELHALMRLLAVQEQYIDAFYEEQRAKAALRRGIAARCRSSLDLGRE